MRKKKVIMDYDMFVGRIEWWCVCIVPKDPLSLCLCSVYCSTSSEIQCFF